MPWCSTPEFDIIFLALHCHGRDPGFLLVLLLAAWRCGQQRKRASVPQVDGTIEVQVD